MKIHRKMYEIEVCQRQQSNTMKNVVRGWRVKTHKKKHQVKLLASVCQISIICSARCSKTKSENERVFISCVIWHLGSHYTADIHNITKLIRPLYLSLELIGWLEIVFCVHQKVLFWNEMKVKNVERSHVSHEIMSILVHLSFSRMINRHYLWGRFISYRWAFFFLV